MDLGIGITIVLRHLSSESNRNFFILATNHGPWFPCLGTWRDVLPGILICLGVDMHTVLAVNELLSA